jgi:PAS domain S-box-containing protein
MAINLSLTGAFRAFAESDTMADASTRYSFIDIATWDGVRENFLSGKPIAVFSGDMEDLLWANGSAASLFGFSSIGEFEAEGPSGLGTALRQIRTAASRAAGNSEITTHIRVTSGIKSKLLPAKVRQSRGNDGSSCIVTVIETGETESDADDTALAAISGLATEGAGAAIVDANGMLVAADPLFSGISFPADAISALVHDVRDEKDRLVKRLVTPRPAVPVAVAIARLTDTPPFHLIMAVTSGDAVDQPEKTAIAAPETSNIIDEAPEPAAPVTIEAPVAPDEAEAIPEAVAEPEVVEIETETEETSRFEEEATGADEADAHAAAAEEPEIETAPAPAFVADFENAHGPVRFVWKTDSDGTFSDISPEFASAVGPHAADIAGRTFEEVARVFELDPSGEISASLKRHDTWSGKSVLWPVEGTAYRVPVDLAALPSYNRQREFEGYRGFGIVRMGERKPDPEKLGLALVAQGMPAAPEDQPEPVNDDTVSPEIEQGPDSAPTSEAGETTPPADPFGGEVPALSSVAPVPLRRESDKIIDLQSKRRSQTSIDALNANEQAAFRQIGDVLGWARKQEGDAEAPAGREMPSEIRDDHISEDVPAESAIETDTVDEPIAEPESPVENMIEEADAVSEIDEDTEAVSEDESETETLHDYMPSAFATGPHDEQDRDGLTPGFLDALPLPILIHRDDVALFANEAFVEMTGYRDAGTLNEAGGIDALFMGEASEDGVLALRTANDATVSARAHMQAVPWHGRTALMFAFEPQTDTDDDAADATDSTVSEAEELRAILDTATDGVVVLAKDGVIRSLNGSASALFGYSGEEIEGKSFGTLFAQESQAAALDYISGLANNGVASVLNEGLEVLGREKNGGFLPLFMTIGRLETSNGFCAVVRDITAWKQTEQALRDAQREAESASSHKSEFLAKISHEIRTPLNAIIGFSELMAEERFGPIGNERYKSYLVDINKSGKHVLDLVNDLLDISKIEAGKQELEFESVPLNEAVNEAIAMIQPQANRNRVIIRSSLDEDLPDVVADMRSLKQIVLNVLSNSVRFTHSGGQVIVSTTYNARGEVVLRIKDTGIGMSTKEIETALQPFQQVASLGRARGDGTGLGLPLTKALVEANRAEFAIQSEPGRGTAVEIVFPPSRVLAS